MWIDLLDDDKSIKSIFGTQKPSLDSFRVKELALDLEKNSLKIVGDLSSFPDNPPLKWKAGKFNTAQVVLEFWNLSLFELGEITDLKVLNFEINRKGEEIECCAGAGFKCRAEIFDLIKISGYQNSTNL